LRLLLTLVEELGTEFPAEAGGAVVVAAVSPLVVVVSAGSQNDHGQDRHDKQHDQVPHQPGTAVAAAIASTTVAAVGGAVLAAAPSSYALLVACVIVVAAEGQVPPVVGCLGLLGNGIRLLAVVGKQRIRFLGRHDRWMLTLIDLRWILQSAVGCGRCGCCSPWGVGVLRILR
jgi:hypothetical protein